MTRSSARSIAAGVVIAVMVGVSALPAAAHVTVNPPEAARGGFVKLAFRVPNERDDAGTTQVEIVFPEGHGLRSVSVKPNPPWVASVDRAGGDTVQRITWSGGRIAPGEFQEFEVSVGPLPESGDSLLFRALQTYDSGEVVRWIDEPVDGGPESEHPAPVLALVEGDGGAHGHGAAGDAPGDDAPAEDTAADDTGAGAAAGDANSETSTVAWIALVAAGVAVVVSLALAATGRRRAA